MGGGGTSEFLISLFPFIALFAIMYFLILRPQQKRMRLHREMVANVRRGDVVVTAGGLIGKVVKVEDTEAQVEIADGVRVRVVKTTLTDVRSKSEPVPANANTPS
ncbi:preprotein translocase subunit YajC [Parvibaculum sp.]|uniref:preprotein translocase subunit YajC n=1 Tax=Parvibaculum sp. TaxID=2024848 RepID=UPI001E1665D0|nr:preprotein translocase subunit YajC [Parvibaculum sp.]MBX3487957.1 preprotein translocase subunit YajC [Parvibaculum sp.]MBX3493289.1 preprotein translocase subunit YajC [Parvibaculum sp.]MCW5728049.1 preprotein translocase subunit YajC [Parvibaculum sp.]